MNKKKIIDKVLDKKQIKIDYSYGSSSLQKSNNKVKKFFLKFYEKIKKYFLLFLRK